MEDHRHARQRVHRHAPVDVGRDHVRHVDAVRHEHDGPDGPRRRERERSPVRRRDHDGHGPGRVFVADRRGESWPFKEVVFADRSGGELGGLLLSFGQDRAGEVYVMVTTSPELGHASGSVYRLAPAE